MFDYNVTHNKLRNTVKDYSWSVVSKWGLNVCSILPRLLQRIKYIIVLDLLSTHYDLCGLFFIHKT